LMTLPKNSLLFLSLVFFLTLPLAAQTELPITTPTREPAVGNQAAPRAASLGDRALVVWGEGPAFFGGPSIPTSVRAARIDGDGKLLDQNALIFDSIIDDTQPNYDVVASGDRFVVAYSDPVLKVRTVGRDGAFGDPVMLDAYVGSSFSTLRIAASNDGSRFVVVWSQVEFQSGEVMTYRHTAALLDRDLRVLATNIDLGTIPAASSAFALVPRGNGFAVIARSSDARIFAWTLDANAHLTGERTLATGIPAYSIDAAVSADQVWIITAGIELQWSPGDVVSTGPLSGRELLSIGDSAVATMEGGGIALYDLSSPSSRTAMIEVRPPHSVQDAAIVRVTNGTYTVFLTDDGLGQTDVFGALNSGPIDIVAGSPAFQMAQAIASDAGGESLVVWREYSTRGRVWQLLARIVDRAGVPIGEVTSISSQDPDSGNEIYAGRPDVTSDGTRFLVTYGLNTIRGQFVSSGGALIGAPFVITRTAFTWFSYAGRHVSTWNRQRYLVTWVEGTAGRFITNAWIAGAFVGNDGSIGSPFRITGDQASSYSQASSPAGDTLLTAFDANGFESYIVHADGATGGPFFAVASNASTPVAAWSGTAFVAAWSVGGRLQTGVIHPDGSTTVLPRFDFAMSPTAATLNAGGVLVTGVTADGIAVLQLDATGHPVGGPLVVAQGAASPAASETGVLTYTRADERNITRVFVQRPASIIRHRAAGQ
jgi:hypothetical protein